MAREVNSGGTIILGGARTPIGKLSGALAPLNAVELGARAVTAALERTGVSANDIDVVLMGQVLQAGQGGNAARQVAVAAGIPMSVPATTINKMCLSGLNAVHLADLLIRSGEAEIVIAGGIESMTHAPYLLEGARAGYRFGDQPVIDVIMKDGLVCAFEHIAMGAHTERYANGRFSRERLDAFAATSHERAALATKSGRFAKEVVPVRYSDRRGTEVLVEHDEGIRPETTVTSLAKLQPAFAEDGTITAGNASQISDAGAAVIVTTRARAEALGIHPLASIEGYGEVAGPDPSLLTQPSRAISRALERRGASVGDLDIVEINEAFATVALASIDDLGLDPEIVNINGGAIALGHPIGMSGARLALTLATELSLRGGFGAAALCGGGGQGDALLLASIV